MHLRRRVLLILIVLAFALPTPAEDATPLSEMGGLRVGLFTHYTFAGGGYAAGWTRLSPADCRPVPDLNALADSFDARRYAELAAAMHAQYVIFTAFHARMNLLYPSAFWERVLPGHTSRRDVLRDLITELKARGIPLVLYFHPVDGHDLSPAEQARTGWSGYRSGRDPKPWNDLMNGLMDDLGRRYGADLAGFWLDGAPTPERLDGPRFKATLRSHSPRAVVWMNGGGWFPGLSDLAGSEQSPWEKAGTFDTDAWPVDRNQAAIVIGGDWWAACGKVKLTPEKMLRYTVRLAATLGQRNGGVAWSAGPYADNQWETGVAETLAAFGRLLAPIQAAVFGTRPSVAYVTLPGTLQRNTWGVATDAPGGRAVFLHVLNPPAAREPLGIAPAADGRVFRRATLVPSGHPLALARTAQGYALTLSPADAWNPTDTVIRLEVR